MRAKGLTIPGLSYSSESMSYRIMTEGEGASIKGGGYARVPQYWPVNYNQIDKSSNDDDVAVVDFYINQMTIRLQNALAIKFVECKKNEKEAAEAYGSSVSTFHSAVRECYGYLSAKMNLDYK